MATLAILVVVVVREPGLRSALAAHLSLEGFDLLTASGIGYGLLGSAMIRSPSILVIDEALIPCDPDRWLETQRSVGDWDRLVVLTAAAADPGDEWLVRIPQRSARKKLGALLAGWKAESRDR